METFTAIGSNERRIGIATIGWRSEESSSSESGIAKPMKRISNV